MSEATWMDWYGEQGRVATQCHEAERPKTSMLLGPDGLPLKYEEHKIGFDLRPNYECR